MRNWITYEIDNRNELQIEFMARLWNLGWFDLICIGSKGETGRYTVRHKNRLVKAIMGIVFKKVEVPYMELFEI